jgi:glucose-1-phosphate cytidylyltransferase
MKTVILCGGQGTRIRGLADELPKPMIPVGDKPILWHVMKAYAEAGHSDFVLCLGYKGNAIKEFFLNYDAYMGDFALTLGREKTMEFLNGHDEAGWRITFAETGLDTMTGARIRRVQRYVGRDDFMLTYGDGVSDIDVNALLDFHRSHGKAVTVTGVRPPGRFGEIECDAFGRVVEFNEKPQSAAGMISGGYFVCRPAVFDYLGDDPGLVFEDEPMRALVAAGELMVYAHDGFWQCMDTYRDYQLLNSMWAGGRAKWKQW